MSLIEGAAQSQEATPAGSHRVAAWAPPGLVSLSPLPAAPGRPNLVSRGAAVVSTLPGWGLAAFIPEPQVLTLAF